MTGYTYYARFKSGRHKHQIGPFDSREEALAAALKMNPKHKTLCTGYGSSAVGPAFDMRWHDEETNPYRAKPPAAIPAQQSGHQDPA